MDYAKYLYVTTCLSVTKIAELSENGFKKTRNCFLTEFASTFNDRRKRLCYAKSKFGKKNPATGKHPVNYVGACEDGKGYLTVYKPSWYTGRKGSERVFEHTVVMCEALGLTEMPRGFCVHHIDGNTRNNVLSNLALMTISAHTRLHKCK